MSRLALLLMSSLFVLIGCEDELDRTSTTAYCDAGQACIAPLTCSTSLGVCTKGKIVNRPLSAEFIPPVDTGLSRDQRYDIALVGDNQYNTALSASLEIGGVIKELGNPLIASVPAEVIAETPGDIPGTVLRSEVNAIEGLDESYQAFRMSVIPGREYLLSVYPKDEERPPHFIRQSFQQGDSEILITLPQKEGPYAYPMIQGTLHNLEDLNNQGDSNPLAGAEVTAFSVPKSPDDTPLLSAANQTDTKLGLFQLRVPAESASYRLRVEPGAAITGDYLLPTILTSGDAPYVIDITGEYGEVVDIMERPVVPLPTVPTLLRVEAASTLEPIVGATFSLKATLSPESTTSAYGVTSDTPAGVWQGFVIPATYTAEVRPPLGSSYGSIVREVTISADDPEETFTLPLRTAYTGQVVGWDGAIVPGAQVFAILQASTDFIRAPLTGEANDEGAAKLYLDPGLYTFVVVPPKDSPYPRVIIRDQIVQGDALEQVLELPAPQMIQGVITDAEGTPVSDVSVEFYPRDMPDGQSLHSLARLLGTGFTDDGGRYTVLIPPAEEGEEVAEGVEIAEDEE